MSRTGIGRRWTDWWGAGAMLAVAVVALVSTYQGCDKGGGTVSGPTAEDGTARPVAVAPAPQPTATPTAIGDDPVKAFELWGTDDQCIHVKYNGPASLARITTWSTGFENQDPKDKPDLKSHDIGINGTVDRCWTGKSCFQGDADHPGVKEIGGVFFDKNGKVFNPSREPQKRVACQTAPCNPEAKESWVEDREYSDGEWSSCSPNNQPPTTESAVGCFKKKTRTWTSTNICTKQTRTRTEWVYDECECPCELTKLPSWGSFSIDADDSGNNQSVKASILVSNAGTWKLELYAGNSTNDYPNSPDFTKPAVSKTLKCGESFTLVNEYDWKNHESDEWWFKLYLDGALKATSQRIHKD